MAEYVAVTQPHRDRIRELERLIAIEERHIERKGRAVRMKSETIAFRVVGNPKPPSHIEKLFAGDRQ